MEALLNDIFSTLGSYLSNYILIVALLGGGIWFTVKLGFIQVKGFGEGMRRTFGGMFKKSGTAGADGMSSFQALATAIAAQVGTGKSAGAATALADLFYPVCRRCFNDLCRKRKEVTHGNES